MDFDVTLKEVAATLARRFPNTGVRIVSPTVAVPFGTSISERHEIIPADFVGGGPQVYEIPKPADNG